MTTPNLSVLTLILSVIHWPRLGHLTTETRGVLIENVAIFERGSPSIFCHKGGCGPIETTSRTRIYRIATTASDNRLFGFFEPFGKDAQAVEHEAADRLDLIAVHGAILDVESEAEVSDQSLARIVNLKLAGAQFLADRGLHPKPPRRVSGLVT